MENKMKIIAGPCQHESLEQSKEIALECKRVCDQYGFEYYFKASFDKANRTSINGKRGVGLSSTIHDFRVLKEELGLKILTDVHDQNHVFHVKDVVDVTGLNYMLDNFDVPIVFDATHSVQKPGGRGTSSDGNRSYVPGLARAASALGIKNFFLEVHPDPDNAPSDGPNMLHLKDFEDVVKQIKVIGDAARGYTWL